MMEWKEIEEFEVELPRKQHPEISGEELGFKDGENNGEIFRNAIEYCKKKGIATLKLKKGKYYFEKGFHIYIEGMKDFTIDGGGSEFVFSNIEHFMQIIGCDHFCMKNIIVDWDWDKEPLASLAVVENVAEDFSYIDMRFPEYDVFPKGSQIRGYTPLHHEHLSVGYYGGVALGNYHFSHSRWIEPNLLRLYCIEPEKMHFLRPGLTYAARHYVYDASMMEMMDNTHLTLENITVYSAAGNCFVVRGDQSYWKLKHCRLMKRPGTTRCMSGTADGHHITNSKGYFIMEDCDFSFQGDDALNVHDNSIGNVVPVGRNCVLVKKLLNKYLLKVGDLAEFRNKDLSPTGYKAKVTAIENHVDSKTCTVYFDTPFPDSFSDDLIIFNREYHSGHYILRRNKFHQNRARGALFNAGDGLVEDNVFYMTQGAAMQLEAGVERRWSEGYGINNLIFRNNVIESCDTNHWNGAVIYMGVYLDSGRTDYPIFQNVLFENNTIINCPQQAFFLSSCKNVIVRNNVIINPCTKTVQDTIDFNVMRELKGKPGIIYVERASDVYIEDNVCMSTAKSNDSGIVIHKSENVYIKNNKGALQRREI